MKNRLVQATYRPNFFPRWLLRIPTTEEKKEKRERRKKKPVKQGANKDIERDFNLEWKIQTDFVCATTQSVDFTLRGDCEGGEATAAFIARSWKRATSSSLPPRVCSPFFFISFLSRRENLHSHARFIYPSAGVPFQLHLLVVSSIATVTPPHRNYSELRGNFQAEVGFEVRIFILCCE